MEEDRGLGLGGPAGDQGGALKGRDGLGEPAELEEALAPEQLAPEPPLVRAARLGALEAALARGEGVLVLAELQVAAPDVVVQPGLRYWLLRVKQLSLEFLWVQQYEKIIYKLLSKWGLARQCP